MLEVAGKEERQEGLDPSETIFVSPFSSTPHHSQSLFLNYLPDLLPDTEREIGQNTGELVKGV